MSSYKGHTLFALILALIFSFNPLIVSLTIIGANVPDFDHKFKKDNVYKLIILGLTIFILLYVFNLHFYIGLIIIFLGVIFHFSNHRSFTHSIFGVLTLTACLSLIIIGGFELVVNFNILNNYYLLSILIVILACLFLNKKLLLIFLPIFFISLFIIPISNITAIRIIFALFLGVFSHIVLDSFTPSGIKLFAPLHSMKVYKKFGIINIMFLIAISVISNFSFYMYLISIVI